MPAPQSFKNHGRFDPPMHFFVVPILFANVIVAALQARYHSEGSLGLHLWLIFVSTALLVFAVRTRINDLKNQNRIIRIEERLRFAALLSPTDLAASASLSLPQIVALRFASDAELSGLISRTLAQGLTPKQIKESITIWRPDYDRV